MTETESILIVDDDEMILESLVSILDSEGYDTQVAKTGREAIEKTDKEFFNAVLIDIRLPDMTGIELLSRIRETKPKMKKLILTGFPDAPTAIEAVNQRADAYLVKPFNPEQLLDLLEENLKQQKDELKYTQEKVLEYIKTRVQQLDNAKKTEFF
ncbi:response regulator [Candidatus Bathyarchaeota archaeon]|nr:response regulator [Candidatus Bathyarchaeota archaeon]